MIRRRRSVIDGVEAAVEVLVHPGLGEVELGLFVFLVAGEFLADVIAEVVFEVWRAVRAVGRDLLAEWHEVSPRDYLTERIDEDTRATELIRYRPFRRRVRLGRCGRILGGKLPGRVNKDRHLGQNAAFVAVLLDAFALAVVEIVADKLIDQFTNCFLLVVSIEEEATRNVSDQSSTTNNCGGGSFSR